MFNPKTWNEDYVETDEPEVFIRGDSQANPEQVRPKKKAVISRRDQEAVDAEAAANVRDEKAHIESVPRELI